MQVDVTEIPELRVITPQIYRDQRGLLLETWQAAKFADADLDITFVQDNFSHSTRGILRGLHYQIEQPQGKLVHVTRGKVLDVAVDLRRSSPAFGKHVAVELDSEQHRMMYIPPGCAHGFLVLSEDVDFCYRCTDFYAPHAERTLLWNDPALGIDWPLTNDPLLSEKDKLGKTLAEADCYP